MPPAKLHKPRSSLRQRPLRRSVLTLATAGLMVLSYLPMAARADNDLPLRIVTDGDPTSPDDFVAVLDIQPGETLTALDIIEAGVASSLAGHYRQTRFDTGYLKLQLDPAIDFDQFLGSYANASATLAATLADPAGNLRTLTLPVSIVPPTVLAQPIAMRLAIGKDGDEVAAQLPLPAVGNLHLAGINHRSDDTIAPLDYTLGTDLDSELLVRANNSQTYVTGRNYSYDLLWQILPAGRRMTQTVSLIPVLVSDFNQTQTATLDVAPDSGANQLALTFPGAINLAVTDILLVDTVSAGTTVTTSLIDQFQRNRSPSGDLSLTLKSDSTLAKPSQIGDTLTLRVQKRLELAHASQEVWQTVKLTVGKSIAAASGPGSSGAVADTGMTANTLWRSDSTATSTNGAATQTAAAPAANIQSQFAPYEAPAPDKPVDRKKHSTRSGNRLATGPTTTFQYDANGNLTSIADPLGHTTLNTYDGLDRRVSSTDALGNKTTFTYSGIDQLASVTLPRNLTTTYTVTGLGDRLAENSPETGLTQNTYDAAGHVLTRTDAKGQTTTYAYDALGRVTSQTQQDGSSTRYTYDQGSNGIGRLTRIDELASDGSTTRGIAYAYDPQGRVLTDTRTVAGVSYLTSYRYDQGRLAGITYPSGRRLDYGFDSAGRVSSIQLTDSTATPTSTTLVQNVGYQPFAGVRSYTNGAGQTLSRAHDNYGQLTAYDLGPRRFTLTYDAASRITAQSATQTDGNAPTIGATYVYDDLDRLTGAALPTGTHGYSYDAAGNRTSQTLPGETRGYTYATNSNRLRSVTGSANNQTYSFDANGSITGDGNAQYDYDSRGRLTRAILTAGTVRYEINALGQRVRKQGLASNSDLVFHYDLNGRLIAESGADGTPLRDYVWLGDLPLAIVQ